MGKKVSERSVSSFNNELKLKGFNVFQIERDSNVTREYSRKDFFKICLTTGESLINYSDRSFLMKGTILFFANPNVPYSWETISRSYVGYTCLFSEDFYNLLIVLKVYNILHCLKLVAHLSSRSRRKSANF
jgi:AraC family transcriptional regulator, transcriptional activator of pobA